MYHIWIYALVSVIIVSMVSFIGIVTLSLKEQKLKKIVIYLVSFSAGALFGDAFIHLLPEVVRESGFGLEISLYLLFGIVFSFIVEKIIQWNHCHHPITAEHIHPLAVMNLFGDATHNFIDGLIIASSYLISLPVGIATTIAVVLHEIPQEIGDFAILLHGGYSKSRALYFNFFIALTAVLGAAVALVASVYIENMTTILVPFAAGGFIYIAGSDLIPELHKEVRVRRSLLQVLAIILGVAMMSVLLFLD